MLLAIQRVDAPKLGSEMGNPKVELFECSSRLRPYLEPLVRT